MKRIADSKVLHWMGWSVGTTALVMVLILIFVRSLDLSAYRPQFASMVSAAVGRQVTFEGEVTVQLALFPTVRVGGVHIANPEWAKRPNFAKAKSLDIQFALLPLLRGELEIVGIVIEDADVLFERAADGKENWSIAAPPSRDGRVEVTLPAITSLQIERGLVGYRSPSGKLHQLVVSSADAVLDQDRPVEIRARGWYQNRPATVIFRGGKLGDLSTPAAAWPVAAEITVGDASLGLVGNLTTPDLLREWKLEVVLSGEETSSLEVVLAKDLPPIGPFHLSGTLALRQGSYRLDRFRAQIGENTLTGQLKLDLRETPLLSGDLAVASFVPGGLPIFPNAGENAEGTNRSFLDRPLALPNLSRMDLDLSIDINELVYPAVPALRELRLLVRLAKGRLELSLQRMRVANVPVGAAATLQAREDQLDITINAKTEMLPLGGLLASASGTPSISGKAHGITLQVTTAGRSLRQLVSQGSMDLRISSAVLRLPLASEAQPVAVTLRHARVYFREGGPAHLNATVRYSGILVDLDLETATVVDLLWERAAWPARLEAKARGTRLAAKGQIIDPLGARDVLLDVEFAGPSLAALDPVLDLPLASQGPFLVKGQVRLGGKVVKFSKALLKLGDNRISGDLTWRPGQPLPRLEAHLSGEEVVVDDLVSVSQEPSVDVPKGRVIPDFILPITYLPRMEAAIQFDFRHLKYKNTTLGDLSLAARLEHDRLTVYPLIVRLSGTRLIASLDLQDVSATPLLAVWVKVPKLDYGRLLRDLKVATEVQGSAEIEVALSGRGRTLREVLRHAQGTVTVTGGVGRIPNRLLALWGGGAWKLLIPKQLEDAGTSTRLNCIVSRHTVSDGVMRGQMLMDTADVTVAGEQATDLNTEEVRALLQPAPKRFTVFNLGTPVTISGTLGNMQAKLTTADTLLMLGTIAIGVANPVALLYLLPDAGTGETNVCAETIARREKGGESSEQSGLINKARNLLRKLQRPLEDKADPP